MYIIYYLSFSLSIYLSINLSNRLGGAGRSLDDGREWRKWIYRQSPTCFSKKTGIHNIFMFLCTFYGVLKFLKNKGWRPYFGLNFGIVFTHSVADFQSSKHSLRYIKKTCLPHFFYLLAGSCLRSLIEELAGNPSLGKVADILSVKQEVIAVINHKWSFWTFRAYVRMFVSPSVAACLPVWLSVWYIVCRSNCGNVCIFILDREYVNNTGVHKL